MCAQRLHFKVVHELCAYMFIGRFPFPQEILKDY